MSDYPGSARMYLDWLAVNDPQRLAAVEALAEVDTQASGEAKVRLWMRIADANRKAGLPQTENGDRYRRVFERWSDRRLAAWRRRLDATPALHGPAADVAFREWDQVVAERARWN